MKNRPKLYLAGPLFNPQERKFNKYLKTILSPYFDIFLPQEDGTLMVEVIKKGVPLEEARKQVFQNDKRAMDSSQILLIVLDGRTIDEGAAFELGYCAAKDKKCFGLQTDNRRLLITGNNPMIEESLEKIFLNIKDLISWARSYSS